MDHDHLARAREGDLDAFLDLVRSRAARLLRLATIGAGSPRAGALAAASALEMAWRDVRRLHDPADLDGALERALEGRLPRRPAGRAANGPAPTNPGPAHLLDLTLRDLTPGDRLALGRCLDPAPDRHALAVAGRAGVEVEAHAASAPGRPGRAGGDCAPGTGGAPARGNPGVNPPSRALDPFAEIVDLDGPLAGWDLPRLRAALAAATGPLDAGALLDDLRPRLAGTRPATGPLAALRALVPHPAALARGSALALAAVLGAGILAWSASAPGAPSTPAAAGGQADPGPTTGPDRGTGTTGLPSGETGAAVDGGLDTPGEFPEIVEGLPVIGVNAARRLAGDPAVAGRAIAVRGWLSSPAFREPCLAPLAAPPGPAGTGDPAGVPAPDPVVVAVDDPTSAAAAFCLRTTVLREAPGGDWGVAHLHPQLIPGTGLGRAGRLYGARPGEPIPVVVLAHFGDPRAAACAADGRHCGEELVIDRIAWVYGAPARPPVASRPRTAGTDTHRSGWEVMALAEEAYGRLRVVSVTGLPAADLALVEPAAAQVSSPSGFAWLVRAFVEPQRGDPVGAAMTWLVVDDRTGEVVAAPGAVAARAGATGVGVLFPRRLDGTLVRSLADAVALSEAGMPAGATIAVAGWLAAPALAGSCLAQGPGLDGPHGPAAAFCRRAVVLRGSASNGRSLSLQLPPGTPALPVGDDVDGRTMPIPVVALVEAGSPRSEPCWPTDNGCGRALVLERLLWVSGEATDVAVAELDLADGAPPSLTAADVQAVAETAIADRGRVVSIVRVPADRRGDVAPGAERRAIEGDHAWIVRVRSPMIRAGWTTGLDYLWWLLVDDATGRPSTGGQPIAALPGPVAGRFPA